MLFAWTDSNHSIEGHATLHDPKNAIAGMLVDLGHQVMKVGRDIAPRPAVNLIFEGFHEQSYHAFKKARDEMDCDFIIVATETLGRSSLNDSGHKDMGPRQEWLLRVLELGFWVWCLVPGTAAKLKPYTDRAVDIELGYSAARERILRDDRRPDFTCCYHGGAMGRRAEIIALLRKEGIRVITPRDVMDDETKGALDGIMPKELLPYNDYGSLELRNACLARSCLSLGLKPLPDWRLVSSSRASIAMHVGRPVFMEDVDDTECPSIWRRIVPFVPTQHIFDAVREGTRDWRRAHAGQLARFKSLLSPEKAIGHALAALT